MIGFTKEQIVILFLILSMGFTILIGFLFVEKNRNNERKIYEMQIENAHLEDEIRKQERENKDLKNKICSLLKE